MNEHPPYEDYRAFKRPPRRLNWLSAFLFIAGLALGTLMPGRETERVVEQSSVRPVVAEAQTLPAPDPSSAINFDRIVSATARKAMPAVVTIHVSGTVTVRFRDPFFDLYYGTQRRNISGMGSGVIIDPDGLVITNNHVINVGSKTTDIFVSSPTGENSRRKWYGIFPIKTLHSCPSKGMTFHFLNSGLRE